MAEMKFYKIQEYVEALRERGMFASCELYGKEENVIRNLTYNSKEV